MAELRIGVVRGETTTDAVALDDRDRLLAVARVDSTGTLDADISAALRAIVEDGAVDPGAVRWVVAGTGDALAEIAAHQALRSAAVVRIGAPLTTSVPPLATWPPGLRAAVSAGEVVVAGGSEYDGRTTIPLDEDAIARFLADLGDRVESVAISAVFAPVSPAHELAAAEVARRELGGSIPVSLSHEMGGIGLLERENATVVNAALGGVVAELAEATRATLAALGVDAELLFAQNDGSLMGVEHARRFTALMLAGEPGCAIVGAAHLSGVGDAIVVAAGSTTTYIGALVNGIPRDRSGPTEIAGIRMSLRRPDARRVTLDALDGALGETRAAGSTVPLVVVGPGQALVANRLRSISEVITPLEGEFAHAIGATVARVSGELTRICMDEPGTNRVVIDDVRAAALARAIDAGAHPDRVAITEVDEAPLTHLGRSALRVRVRASGAYW
jgi:N-methylhydantoinase A/oxoprolinase/acetone carboxylase beta subunit